MKIYVNKLTDFSIGHSEEAEFAIQNALARLYNLKRGAMTFGNNASYDFILNNTKVELKISSKTKGSIELCRADGRPSGLSATTSDIYLFLNPSGNTAKLRAIRTAELKKAYGNLSPSRYFTIKSAGDKVGSTMTNIDFKLLNDLMVAECEFCIENGVTVFDTDTIKSNTYASNYICSMIQ